MSKRARWQPARGFASRVYERRERWLLRLLDVPTVLRRRAFQRAVGAPPLPAGSVRSVLIFRLDRIGDLIMSMSALEALRAALPKAHLTLAVGRWCEPLARRAPVDEIVLWSAPWVGRRSEGADSVTSLARQAWSLRGRHLDLAIDLQGDVRATMLMALCGARARVGYANTGGGWLLTHVVPLDETVSWVDQNRRAVARAVEGATGSIQPALLGDPDRDRGRALLEERAGVRRPWVGIHLSGGRPVKQWDLGRWQEVAAGLARGFGATIVLTGSNADSVLTVPLVRALGGRAIDLAGRLSLDDTLAVIGALDLFLSSDTGPMHMACAVGTPSVSLFGPSDPVRYFSGGAGVRGARHVVVRADLWCSPCNLIRRPPDECRGDDGPECLDRVQAREVLDRAEELLRLGGYGPCT